MRPRRSDEIRETYGERVLLFGLPGLVAFGLGSVMIGYRGMLIGLGYVLAIGGAAAVLYALVNLVKLRSVDSIERVCPYCQGKNHLVEAPDDGYTCSECHRVVPMRGGRILPIHTVSCGLCGASNYYSELTSRLLCEGCGRDVPLSSSAPAAPVASPAVGPDPNELVNLELLDVGANVEEMMVCLERMLHFNRAQVEDLLGELPATLFTGIPRHRAEMLAAQVSVHGGEAVVRPIVALP